MIALKQARPFERLLIYSIIPEEIAPYIREMQPILGVDIVPADSLESLVSESEVVVTTTPSRKPQIQAEWLHPRLHITAMGADAEGKQELDAAVLAKADRIVCDQKSQCSRLGELHHALEEGLITEEADILELGELTSGQKVGRHNDDEITICDLVGIGVQDTIISLLTYQRAVERGLGTWIEV
jgi:ornithine cyclodeaminase